MIEEKVNLDNEELIGDRIKVIRGYFNKNQADFAKDLEIGQSTLSAIEKNKGIPTIDIVKKLGKMGFSVEWILYGDEISQNKNVVVQPRGNGWIVEQVTKQMMGLSVQKSIFIKEFIDLYMKSLGNKE